VNEARAQLHAPFRSRRGRVMALSAAVLQAAILVLVAVILPWGGANAVGWYDRVAFLVLAALVGWFLLRLGLVSAVPSEEGLVVRNILLTRHLTWADIEGVHFGGGAAWATLDLADGDTLAVMAIQRADGEFGTAEARRLATLQAVHESR
jgi:PH (Pleckstrin Homology) domain-containing protein